MDSFEWNKISAAVISGALLIMVISTMSEVVFHEEANVKPAYTVELPVKEVAVAVEAEVEVAVPALAELMAVASADKGKKQFGKCKACHSTDAGGKNGLGPNLYDIVGRAVAGVDGYKYSGALVARGGIWDYEFLDAWLASPKNAVPGTSMAFAGVKKPGQRADLIAYLRSLSETPVALPGEEG